MMPVSRALLLLFLLSCGTTSELIENKVRIDLTDGDSRVYQLLAVRDTALIATLAYGSGQPQVVHFSKIVRVHHNVDGRTTGMLLGGVAGCGLTLGTGIVIANKSDPQSGLGIAFATALASVPAILTGMFVGYSVSDDEATYDVQDHSDRNALKGFSKYPDKVPPEIELLK